MPKQHQQSSKQDSTWSALSFAWELGYSIVIPLVILLLGGIFFDRRFGTSPRFTFIGVGVSFVTTIVLLIVKVRTVLRGFDSTPVSTPNKQHSQEQTPKHTSSSSQSSLSSPSSLSSHVSHASSSENISGGWRQKTEASEKREDRNNNQHH